MYATLVGFKWDNDKDRKWLTNYFSDNKRQPKSGIKIPSIKRVRSEESHKKFEHFFDALKGGSDDDKKLRKNTISAWKSKLKQQNNYRQLNIELTHKEYEQLIKIKDLNGDKSTIKDTILDLIFNEYQVQENILMSLEDKIRREITREVRNEIREKVTTEIRDKERKNTRQFGSSESLSTNQIDNESQLMVTLDTFAKETNTRFETLTSLLTELQNKMGNTRVEKQCSTLKDEAVQKIEKSIAQPEYQAVDFYDPVEQNKREEEYQKISK